MINFLKICTYKNVMPSKDAIMDKKSFVSIHFPKKLFIASGMSLGDAISYRLEEEKLILTYIGYVTNIPRATAQSRLVGRSSVSFTISEGRLPELFKLNIPTSNTKVFFEIQDGKLILDLSAFKVITPVGFRFAKTNKAEIKKVAGFAELAKLVATS